ncbi:MAG: methionyl-tRNA formyltransferase [Verrucomicrobiales bacterium]|nr:methionyl-tRNA formyltransferase [Verrucomicrobiales bacterium]
MSAAPENNRHRIVYFGTAEFACPALVALEQDPAFEVVGVVTQPDRPRGRQLHLHPSPVKETAGQLGLEVWQPARCRAPEFLGQLAGLAPDCCVVAAYGQILPRPLLELPKHGCVNIHGSLLPKYRGAAPVQWALADGEPHTGVTIMRLDEGLDTGPMLASESTPIWPEDDAQSLHDRLATQGADLLLRTLRDYLAGILTPVPQPAEGASYARKITREDGRVDWSLPAEVVARRIRAFTPWPGAFTFLPTDSRRLLKILSAEPLSRAGAIPGTVMKAGPESLLVACGEGVLQIHEVQREGGRRLTVEAFLAGFPLEPGTQLG